MPPAEPLVLAVDQGSSATKAVLVDRRGRAVATGRAPVTERHPEPGHVEQSAVELLASVHRAVADCLSGYDASRVVAVGLSTQRESVVLWDSRNGEPAGPVLSWQDRRTVAEVERMAQQADVPELVRRRTGLPLDPMFSASKARWLLEHADPRAVRAGHLRLGTMDAWLLHNLTGANRTELGNASRTQLLELDSAGWDDDLLDLFGIPRGCLPEVAPSAGPLGTCRGLAPLPDGVPVTAVLGDSHAALFAHGVTGPGVVKVTYGTGSSVMGLVDPDVQVAAGLCRTIAWADPAPRFAVEGNIRATGATIRWLAGFLGLGPAEVIALAAASQSDGVQLVPGFTGLGAPWWDGSAVGLVSGLTLGATPAQLARAAVESIACQVEDVLAAVDALGTPVTTVLADGGASADDSLMQLQADLSGRVVRRSADGQLSANGAARMAGLGCGLWTEAELPGLTPAYDDFRPALDPGLRARRLAEWHDAVDRSRGTNRQLGGAR
ncbi:glycerol kinase [Kribbella orskensis]|uniref:ATP:glycerol 3-phosphotransferase n=1 Tax=Kribbella orskensis TaxID=2512216 RepID=A0ABY2BHA4_9ACTN|nr:MULTISPECIES: FGGY family carbohydrate kinase [Kribbella]TCN38335.1 glycerol kinase [Kribbella sp. VKM Ac-2500]TCO20135.1 glycerol kinase [Kribbella orskensis]